MNKIYIPPELIIVPIKVERGYSASIDPTFDLRISKENNHETVEDRTVSNNWVAGDDDGFWSNQY